MVLMSSKVIGYVNDVYLGLLVGCVLGLVVILLAVVLGNPSGLTVSSLEQDSLEGLWTLTPGLVLGILCSSTLKGLYTGTGSSSSAVSSLCVVGSQWYWECNGIESRIASNYVSLSTVSQPWFIPSGSPHWVSTTSGDVIHSLSITGAGLKLDSVPGSISSGSVSLIVPGVYTGYCSELCGSGHGMMPLNVICYNPSK